MQRGRRLKRLVHPGPWLGTTALGVLCAAAMSACGGGEVTGGGRVRVEPASSTLAAGAERESPRRDDSRGSTTNGTLISVQDDGSQGPTSWAFDVEEGCEIHSDDVDLDALAPLLNAHQARISAQASAIGCLVRSDGRSFAGTAWVLDSERRHIVTARHVLVGKENPFGPDSISRGDLLRWTFQLPCKLGGRDKVVEYDLNEVVFDGGNDRADLDLVVLELDKGEPLPAGLPVSQHPPPIAADALGGRRWVLVPGYPSRIAVNKAIKYNTPSDDPLRCIPDEAFEKIVQGIGYVGAPGEEAWTSWPFFLHTADTQPGVSGAPVIDLSSGLVIGVHTHFAAEVLSANLGRHGARLKSLNTNDHNLAYTTSPLCALKTVVCHPNP